MASTYKDRRWAKVATAVALCLPCSSFITPAIAQGTEAPQANINDSLASLPPMRTQSQYINELKNAPVQAQETTSVSVSTPRADITSHENSAPAVAANKVTPVSTPTSRADITQDANFARVAAAEKTTAQGPQPTMPMESEHNAKIKDTPNLVPREVTENKAALKTNYDFFPPITEYYKPDPTYAKVRWQGGAHNEKSGDLLSSMSRGQFSGVSDNASRGFLRKMVSRALAYSPEIRVASAEVLASEYNVNQAEGQRWPQVRLGIATPFTTMGGDSQASRNNSNLSDTSGSVSVSTPIIDWGKISNQVDNAQEMVKSARYAKEYSREQLAYNTISELMNLGRYQRSRIVAKAYVDRMQELVSMLSQITQADPGRDSELVQAKAKLMSAQASMDNVEHQLSTSRIKLVRLLGLEPKLPENISWRDTVIPASVAIASLDKNPMMLNLQAKVRAAEYEAESIKSSGLPQVNWVISKNTAKNTNGDETGWYTGLNVEWNAFSGGSQRAAQMSARAKANAAQQQYEVSYRDLEYQINNQVQIRDSSFLRADDYDRLSTETDRVRQMFYDQWYHLGKRTLLDVLTAENDHFNNQLSAINNRYDGYISNINVIASASMLLAWVGINADAAIDPN
jgi:adhesin transport system outer membrane protein